eukprot:TRINITY_DN47846_c0_g1_i1.p1 TRINITY_DN47846_c0_g1~~TRINITY_DN47846_c0_g1_i1.p1  ORF type:complete len:630 (-),score=82.14 TRINITY_DN47846_c0_g1_i1:125-2014(-)
MSSRPRKPEGLASAPDFLKLLTSCNHRQWQQYLVRKKHAAPPQVPATISRSSSASGVRNSRREGSSICNEVLPRLSGSNSQTLLPTAVVKEPSPSSTPRRLGACWVTASTSHKHGSRNLLAARGAKEADLSLASTRVPSAASSRSSSAARRRTSWTQQRPTSAVNRAFSSTPDPDMSRLSTPRQVGDSARSSSKSCDIADKNPSTPPTAVPSPWVSSLDISAVSHVDDIGVGVDEDAIAKTYSPQSGVEISYQGLVAVSRPPRPKTPGSGIGATLMPPHSSSVSPDGTMCFRVDVVIPSTMDVGRTPESATFAPNEHSPAGDHVTETCAESMPDGTEAEIQEHVTCQNPRETYEDFAPAVPKNQASTSIPGAPRETYDDVAAAMPQNQASTSISGARRSPALRSLQGTDTSGTGKLDSARSDIACKGTPTGLEAIELNSCYAEVAKGCLGHSTAQWLADRLTQGEPPAAEELEACLTFSSYDQDGDGRLSVLELGTMLRDQGMQSLDYRSAQKAIELTASPGAKGLRLDGFLRLLKFQKDSHMGYSEQQLTLLRDVFDAYDVNKTGSLETLEISELFADLGRAPETREEAEELKAAIASCRVSRVPGPVTFKEFLCLARKLDDAEVVHE